MLLYIFKINLNGAEQFSFVPKKHIWNTLVNSKHNFFYYLLMNDFDLTIWKFKLFNFGKSYVFSSIKNKTRIISSYVSVSLPESERSRTISKWRVTSSRSSVRTTMNSVKIYYLSRRKMFYDCTFWLLMLICLQKMSDWKFLRKVTFNPDIQTCGIFHWVIEFIFSGSWLKSALNDGFSTVDTEDKSDQGSLQKAQSVFTTWVDNLLNVINNYLS